MRSIENTLSNEGSSAAGIVNMVGSDGAMAIYTDAALTGLSASRSQT